MLPPDPTEPQPGDRIGRYTVVSVLGRGGMGAVFEAEDSMLGRRAAVKLLPPHTRDDPTAAERFLVEARAAARLEHANVVGVYEVGIHGKDRFIAMHLIRGESAQSRLEAGPLPWSEAVRIIAQACKGLEAAHKAGIVHRDIKPANLLIGSDGVTRVADFGLAKARGTAGSELTRTGVMVGTPQYMSPEQCQTETADARSDIYSLGATLYALLVGRPPYDRGGMPQILYAQVYDPVPDPRDLMPDLPEGCAAVVSRAMQKRPQDRYADAAAMRADLERLLDLRDATVVLGNGLDRLDNRTRRAPGAAKPSLAKPHSRLVVGAMITGAVALLAGIGAGVYALRRTDSKTDHPVVKAPDPAPGDGSGRPDPATPNPPVPDPAVPDPTVPDPTVPDPSANPEVADEYSKLIRAAADARASRNAARISDAVADLRRFAARLAAGSPAEKKFAAAALADAAKLQAAPLGSTGIPPIPPPPSGDLPHPAIVHSSKCHKAPVTLVHFTKDGHQRISASIDGSIHVRQGIDGTKIAEEDMRIDGLTAVHAMSFNSDSTLLAVGGRNGPEGVAVVLKWDTRSPKPGEEVARFPADCGRQEWLAFSPKENLLAYPAGGAAGREIRFVHVLEKRDEPPLRRGAPVLAAAWSPDGSLLCLGLADGTAEFIDAKSRSIAFTLVGRTRVPICRAAFSPDGSIVAMGDVRGGLRLGSIADRAIKSEQQAHRTPFAAIDFSPDGAWLITTGRERELRVWSVAPLAPVGVMQKSEAPVPVFGAAFRRDGRFVAGGTATGDVLIWSMSKIAR